MNDYLLMELILKERLEVELRTETPGLFVFTAADLAGMEENNQPAPAVHVFLGSDDPIEETSEREQRIAQTWFVVPVVRNARNLASGDPARRDSGRLVIRVLRALQGWDMPTYQGVSFSALKRVKSPLKPLYRAGYMLFPLLFKTEFVFTV